MTHCVLASDYLSDFFSWLTLLHLCHFLDMPSTFLPQGFCTYLSSAQNFIFQTLERFTFKLFYNSELFIRFYLKGRLKFLYKKAKFVTSGDQIIFNPSKTKGQLNIQVSQPRARKQIKLKKGNFSITEQPHPIELSAMMAMPVCMCTIECGSHQQLSCQALEMWLV